MTKVLKMKHLVLYLRHFILLVAYEWAQSARVLHYKMLEWLAKDKYLSLPGLICKLQRKDIIVNTAHVN